MTDSSEIAMPMDYHEFNRLIVLKRRFTGAASEFLVAADLSSLGCSVTFPVATAPKFDIVADKDGILYRIQVKTMQRKRKEIAIPTGSYRYYDKNTISGKKLKRQYKRGDFDMLAALDRESGMVYYVPEFWLDYSLPDYKPKESDLERLSFEESRKTVDANRKA